MPRFFWFRFRMLTEMSAFGLFLFGFFNHVPLLTNIGGGVLIAWDILSIWTGVLRPGFPIIATLIASLFFTPWWYGAYWASAAFSVIDIPFYLVWMFRPPMPESDVISSEEIEAAEWKPKKNGLYVTAIIVVVGLFILYFVAMNLYGQTTTRLNIPVLKTPELQAEQLIWKNGSFANHAVSMDYPDSAIIDSNNPGLIEINEQPQGFALLWSDNATGRDIGNIIDVEPTKPDFATWYVEFAKRYILEGSHDPDAKIISIDEPVIRDVGQYTAVIVDVVIYKPSQIGHETIRILMASFDCGAYVCQAQLYKDGDESFTNAQWDQAFHMIASISFTEH